MAMSEKEHKRLLAEGWEFLGHISYDGVNAWERVNEHMDALRGDKRFEFMMHNSLPGEYVGQPNYYSVWKKGRRTFSEAIHDKRSPTRP